MKCPFCMAENQAGLKCTFCGKSLKILNNSTSRDEVYSNVKMNGQFDNQSNFPEDQNDQEVYSGNEPNFGKMKISIPVQPEIQKTDQFGKEITNSINNEPSKNQIPITESISFNDKKKKTNRKALILSIFIVVSIILAIIGVQLVIFNNSNDENLPDKDNDGTPDKYDDFPDDPNEQRDIDGDGKGDNIDKFPNDPSESRDYDGDGIGDNLDPDNDNDGYIDINDPFPLNESEWADWDGDRIGDNSDPFIVKTITDFSSSNLSTYYCPRFHDGHLYFIQHNLDGSYDPPAVISQSIVKYNITDESSISIYYDDSTVNTKGRREVEKLWEIAITSNGMFFTKETIRKVDNVYNFGFSINLWVYRNNQDISVKGTEMDEYCLNLRTHEKKILFHICIT